MPRKIEVEIIGDSKSLERAFTRSSKAGSDFAGGINKAGIAAAAGIATFSVAAVKGVQAASNLNEQVSRSGQVFGANAAEIQDWSKTTADAFGLSSRAALQAASDFGQMLQTAGVVESESAAMSKRIVELAGDLASFNDIDPTLALEKLRSGLAGEAEPLRQLGVFLSEARVAQEAFALGIAETGDELTEAQKVQARYSLILKDTAKAQGDFARTSDSVANASRRIRAQFEDAAASVSSVLLPAVSQGLDAVAGFIADFSEAKTVEAKIDVVIGNAKEIASSVAGQIGDAVSEIDWSAVFERASGIAEGLEARLEDVDFGAVGAKIGDAFTEAAKVALPAARDVADSLSAAVREIDFEELGREAGPGLAAAIAEAFVTLLDPAFWLRNWDLALSIALAAFGGPIGRFAGRAAGLVVESLSRGLARIAPELGAAFRGLAIQAVRLFGAGLSALVGILRRVLAPLTGIVGGVFSRLGRLASFTVKVLGIQAVINTIQGLVSDVIGAFSGLAGRIGGAFRDAFDFVIREALEFIRDLLGATEFLGRFDPFKGIRGSVERQLAAMEQSTKDTTTAIQKDLNSIKAPPPIEVRIETVIGGEGPGSGETVRGAPSKGAQKIIGTFDSIIESWRKAGAAAVAKAQGLIAKSKKDFENALEGMQLDLDAAELTAGFADDLRVLGEIEAAILRQMKIEGETADLVGELQDVRKARAAVMEDQAQEAREAFQSALGAIELRVDQAAATKGFADDLAANTALQNTIRARIKVEGETTELMRQLFAAQEARKQIDAQIVAARKEQTQKDQFRALGLTGEGDKPTPTIANLQKQLGSLEQNVKGTILDTPKTQAMFERIRKVLAGGWGKATEETREKIREFFAMLRGELNSGEKKGPLTLTTALDTSKLVEGIEGLTPEQIRELRGRASVFNSAGRALGPTVQGAGSASTATAPGSQNFQFDLYIDGEQVAATVIPRVQKKNNRTPARARGRGAGRSGI